MWADAVRRVERIDNYPRRLAERRAALGVNATDAALPAGAVAGPQARRVDNQRVLEGYLVLEEMLIEMKSILLSRRLLDNVSRERSLLLPNKVAQPPQPPRGASG